MSLMMRTSVFVLMAVVGLCGSGWTSTEPVTAPPPEMRDAEA